MKRSQKWYLLVVGLLVSTVVAGSVGLYLVVSPGLRATAHLREEATELALLGSIDDILTHVTAVASAGVVHTVPDLAGHLGPDHVRADLTAADSQLSEVFRDLEAVTDEAWIQDLALHWAEYRDAVASLTEESSPNRMEFYHGSVDPLRVDLEDALAVAQREELTHISGSIAAVSAAEELLRFGLPGVAVAGFAGTVGLVWFGVLWRRERIGALERRVEYSDAISGCAQILLRGTSDAALESALARLLPATKSESIFLERNVHHETKGFGTSLVTEVLRPGASPDPEGMWSFVPWSDMPAAHAALSKGKPYAFETSALSGAESEIYENTAIAFEVDIPVFSRGEWVGLIGFANDDPDVNLREDEVTLLMTVAEMIGAYWERLQVQQELEKLIAAKDDFIASVSHELRTPLAVVLGLSMELADGGREFETAELGELLRMIAHHTSEVSALVDDLLVAARADIDRIAVAKDDIEIGGEIEGVISEVAQVFDRPITVDFARGPHFVTGDPSRVRQIIRNLVANAAKYGGPEIVVSVRTNGEVCTITVADDGPPIPDARRHEIFDRYGRAHKNETQPASMGLGLHVATTLAEIMGGSLTYRHDGSYSLFALELPATHPSMAKLVS